MLTITEIPAFDDNYFWIVRQTGSIYAYVVDPGLAQPVIDYILAHDLILVGVLITHKHADHVGGIQGLQDFYQNSLPVYGPKAEGIAEITHEIINEQTLSLPHLDANVQVISVAGHTLGHHAYLIEDAIFCGDTLFSVGCGRIFEGSAEQMLASLTKLASLPGHCKIYCAHEYTQSNINFALTVTPNNADLLQYASWVAKVRAQNKPSLPSLLSTELAVNPFLRCHTDEIKAGVARQFKTKISDELQTFTLLRQWKDHFQTS
jgi:hydroxyacylglutathione hydrolase